MNRLMSVLLVMVAATVASAIPPMPRLEAAIDDGAIVTTADIKADGVELETSLIVESYMKMNSQSEQEVRERYRDLLSVVAWTAGAPWDKELYDAFYARVSVDTEDPHLRHYALIKELNADPGNRELLERVREGIIEMEQRGYSPIRIAAVSWDYRYQIRKTLRDDDLEEPINRFLFERIARAAAMVQMDTETRRYLWKKFVDPFADTKNREVRDLLIEVFEQTEGVDEWFMQMIRGANQYRVGWKIRGTKYAYQTSDESFEGFHKHLDRAMVYFQLAYTIDPMCPSTSQFMVRALFPRGEDWDEAGWIWFENTVLACVDYNPVYDTLREVLKPKWQGNANSRSDLGIWCNNPRLYKTGVPLEGLYTLDKVMWSYGVEKGGVDYFWEDEGPLIDSIIKALEGSLEAGDNRNPDYERTELAYLYYKHKQDLDKASEFIRACEDGFDDNAKRLLGWDDLRLEFLVLPLVGETAPIAKQAHTHEFKKEYDQAIELWNKVLGVFEDADDELAAKSVRGHIQSLRWAQQYAEGRWVDLGFDEQMNGWWTHDGIWERGNESTVKAKQRKSEKETLLIADLQPGTHFEISADIEFVGQYTKYSTMGIFFHRGQRKTDQWDQMRNLSVRLGKELGSIGWHFAGNDYSEPIEIPEDGLFTLRVVVLGDTLSGYVNGQLIGQGEVPNWKPEKEPELTRIGLGAFAPGTRDAVFSNIRIRKRRPVQELEF